MAKPGDIIGEPQSERAVKRVKAGWTDIVLVCRKCSRKLDGGFGKNGEERFANALRRVSKGATSETSMKGARRRSIGVIEVECLDICPKRAVVAMRAGAPGEWLVVPAGLPIDEAARQLGLSSPHE